MAQQYKPGDWYEKPSGNVMQYDGSKWKDVGQRIAPGGQAATRNGRLVTPPGGAVNPVVAQEAAATAGNSVSTGAPTPDFVIRAFSPQKPSTNLSSNTKGILRYPVDPPIKGDTDYIVFGFYKYDPPFGRGQGGDGVASINSGSAGYDLYTQSGVAGKTPVPNLEPIIMYMPEDIQSQYSARWAGAGFGAFTAGALRTAGTDLNAIPAGLESIPGMIKNAVFQKITDAVNKIPGTNVSLNQVLGGVTGTVLNPNVEMMYEAPDLRGFNLSFKMTPRSGSEATNIKRICNRFKKAMLPTFGGQALFGTATAPNLLTIPSLCQVSFMKGDSLHPYLPQYKLCAITDVSINYTPDGSYNTYGDGSPVATELRITFKEIKLVFADEINESGVTF